MGWSQLDNFSESSEAPLEEILSRESDRDFSKGLRNSVFIHAAFLIVTLLASVVLPGKPKIYTPTLRVDLVGLPDVLKKDLGTPSRNAPSLEEIKKTLDRSEKTTEKILGKLEKAKKALEKAQPDELVLKPKKESPEEAKARENKLKMALARMKALSNISSSLEKPAPDLIKGNRISKGTTLSGDAREALEASYYDILRARLQDNWALPVWIARQNLSAQVQITIDSRGLLRSFKFLKISGNPQFDAAVKQTLTESQPYPLPPEEIRNALLTEGILVGFPL